MAETVKEAQKRIDLENRARNICYRRFSRIRFVKLSESQRKEFMANCVRFEYDKALEREKQEVLRLSRRDPEEQIRQRGLERLEEIRLMKEYDEGLKNPWQ